MRRPPLLAPLISSLAVAGLTVAGLAADGPQSGPTGAAASAKVLRRAQSQAEPTAPAPPPFAEQEAAALDLIRQHLPELLQVLEPLKVTKPAEYSKAITEIASEARTLTTIRAKNAARAALALDAWKTRTHVQLVAAQLARTPTPERASELRAAIEARVDVDVRRHRFEAEQAEAALVRARENLARAEANRDRTRDAATRIEQNRAAKVEDRFRALQPKKAAPSPTAPKKPKGAAPMPDPMPLTSLHGKPMPLPPIAARIEPMPTVESLAEGDQR